MVRLKLCVDVTCVSLVCGHRTHSKRGEAMKSGQRKADGKEAKGDGEEE